LWKPLWALGRLSSRRWFRRLDEIRDAVDLAPSSHHPLFDGWSPDLHLVLFSQELGAPQKDWPKTAVQVGFPLHDRGAEGEGLPLALDVFLRQGEPPLVFTLGSSAVFAAGGFYAAAAEAARKLGKRAILLTGQEGLNELPGVPSAAHAPAGTRIVQAPYAPHSEVMPRALATVHQGGIGTTAQALRAGKPMLVVPFSHDQPDNASRCVRLGVARMLRRDRVTGATLAQELEVLLADAAAAKRAQEVAKRMKKEPGAAGAAAEIERLLAAAVRAPITPFRVVRKKR
jgi:UDP:flavonoid glycosyltransferase YjiC (YdhE family)